MKEEHKITAERASIVSIICGLMGAIIGGLIEGPISAIALGTTL
jgi:hypothetical protein